jgi:transposase
MDLYLDRLLNLPDITIESCHQNEKNMVLKVDILREESECPHCKTSSHDVNQNNSILIRDLSISGQHIYLEIPRRQFYCANCQKYFTERLSFVDWERRYTQRYEDYIYHRVQVSTVEQVKREENLSWDQVQGIFKHKRAQLKKLILAQLIV